MIMNSKALSLSIAAPSGKRMEYIQNIRMGSRSFSYQPCKYVTDDDWTEICSTLWKDLVRSGVISLSLVRREIQFLEITLD